MGEPVTFSSGGRDRNGDGTIDPNEGFAATRPRSIIFSPMGSGKRCRPFAIWINSQTPLQTAIARGAQEQITRFFASDGEEIIHPEPAHFFEMPIMLPLPEVAGFVR